MRVCAGIHCGCRQHFRHGSTRVLRPSDQNQDTSQNKDANAQNASFIEQFPFLSFATDPHPIPTGVSRSPWLLHGELDDPASSEFRHKDLAGVRVQRHTDGVMSPSDALPPFSVSYSIRRPGAAGLAVMFALNSSTKN